MKWFDDWKASLCQRKAWRECRDRIINSPWRPSGRNDTCVYEFMISLDNLTVSYGGWTLFDNISFLINPKDRIGLVGRNGAGKTTLIKLLCGLYAPTGGRILLNGKDIATIAKNSYFDLFSTIFQDYYFLPMTIQQNITASLDYDREKFDLALQKAEMYDKVYALPKGADTLMDRNVYKDAVDFSGGEKQKLLLAKAMYKDAPILILDEPTAALDPIAENEIYSRFNSFVQSKTAIYISHRLSSCVFCDTIAVFDHARLVESGTHTALLAADGQYAALWNAQAKYYV